MNLGDRLAALLERVYILLMKALEPPFAALQRVVGIKGMPYAFVLPNVVLFGLFIFVPVVLNVWYAFTGSNHLLIGERPGVGLDNFASLLDCKNYLDVNSCAQDRFWRAVHNTALFVVLQVSSMVVLSLIAALILNGRIVARGFFRAAPRPTESRSDRAAAARNRR